jgi:hypothetical protein
MPLVAIISKTFELRAFLILAALITLCVSNNVGPSFLPMPFVLDRTAETSHSQPESSTLIYRSTAKSETFRVPIMAQAQKRADKDQQSQPLVGTLKVGFVPPNDARVAAEVCFRISLVTSPFVSQPLGRGPPRSP